jgi:hypothetical protein
MADEHDIVWFKNALPIHYFLVWLVVQQSSQLRINYIGLAMVPTGAHSVSLTMKITTTCSLNALNLKRYGGMFVTDATFLEWGKAGMNGVDGLLSIRMLKL